MKTNYNVTERKKVGVSFFTLLSSWTLRRGRGRMGGRFGRWKLCGGRGYSPSHIHTFMMWAESEKSAEEGRGARLVGEVGGLGAHWAGMECGKGVGGAVNTKKRKKLGPSKGKGQQWRRGVGG